MSHTWRYSQFMPESHSRITPDRMGEPSEMQVSSHGLARDQTSARQMFYHCTITLVSYFYFFWEIFILFFIVAESDYMQEGIRISLFFYYTLPIYVESFGAGTSHWCEVLAYIMLIGIDLITNDKKTLFHMPSCLPSILFGEISLHVLS